MCKGVVVYSESFFTQQLSGISTNLVKCQKKLLQLSQGLQKWAQGKGRGKRPSKSSVQKSVQEILAPQFMQTLIKINIDQKNALPQLNYTVDHEALATLAAERLGRTVLITDQLQWPTNDVVSAYRNLASIEDAFKNMKNINFLRWQPAYHWTDQKLHVHGFYCVLALMLATLARKIVVEAGVNSTLPALLIELCDIRQVAVIYPKGTLAHPKDHIALTRMTPRQKKLVKALQIEPLLA
jgi:transposase